MSSLETRVGKLEAEQRTGDCRDAWHEDAGKLAVLIQDVDTGELPSPPTCPSCGAEPALVIHVCYVDDWRSEEWNYEGRPVKHIEGDASISDL